MKLSTLEKQTYLNVISQEIFHKPVKNVSWENMNTLLCNVIARCPGELNDSERNQLIAHIKEQRQTYPTTKTYDWMD